MQYNNNYCQHLEEEESNRISNKNSSTELIYVQNIGYLLALFFLYHFPAEHICTTANPCMNGGTCFQVSDYFCMCPTEFTGTNCQDEGNSHHVELLQKCVITFDIIILLLRFHYYYYHCHRHHHDVYLFF